MTTATTLLTPLSAAEIQSIERLYRTFSDNQPDLLDQAVTPDWQDLPLGPGQGPGPQGLKPIIQAFHAAFPDMQILVHEITATHKTVSIALHEFHHLRDGRITHTWHLEDWFGMFQQIGTLPPAL